MQSYSIGVVNEKTSLRLTCNFGQVCWESCQHSKGCYVSGEIVHLPGWYVADRKRSETLNPLGKLQHPHSLSVVLHVMYRLVVDSTFVFQGNLTLKSGGMHTINTKIHIYRDRLSTTLFQRIVDAFYLGGKYLIKANWYKKWKKHMFLQTLQHLRFI